MAGALIGALRPYAASSYTGTLVEPPAEDGWPETHADRTVAVVTMTREASVPAGLRQAAILAMRDFFEGQRSRHGSDRDAIEILARPWIPVAHPNVLERLDRAAAGLGRPGLAPLPNNPGGEMADQNLIVAIVDASGAQSGAAVVWPDSGGTWYFTVEPTAAAPRIKLTLPVGLALDTVVDTVDGNVTSDFVRDGTTQSWLSASDYDGPARVMVLRAS